MEVRAFESATVAQDDACAAQLTRIVNAIVRADVPGPIAAILSSATLTVLLKKDEETMEDMRRRQGVDEYVQPSRPLSWAWAASSRNSPTAASCVTSR